MSPNLEKKNPTLNESNKKICSAPSVGVGFSHFATLLQRECDFSTKNVRFGPRPADDVFYVSCSITSLRHCSFIICRPFVVASGSQGTSALREPCNFTSPMPARVELSVELNVAARISLVWFFQTVAALGR